MRTIPACQIAPTFLNNTCYIDEETQFCKFHDLQLNLTHLYIQPKSEISPDQVTLVDLGGSGTPRQGSKIHTLTNEFCDTFPSIEHLNAANLDLQIILENALANCHNLKVLILEKNSLQELDGDIFVHNTNLLYLDVSDNLIVNFEMELFQTLSNLRAVDLSVNFLSSFDVKKILMEVPLLKGLVLRDNELSNLDEKEVVAKFPALEYLYLCPSPKISSFRIKQIIDYLEENGIKTMRELCPSND